MAEQLFTTFQRDFPSEAVKAPKGRAIPSRKDIDARLQRFYGEARKEREKSRLWLVNWARVVFKLQQRLLLAGYPQEIVSKLLLAMIFSSHQGD